MLKVSNLYVSVGSKRILNGVSLKIKRGEIHAVMGPNGSGKSTLAYTLMGHPDYKIQNPKSKIQINNKNILDLKPEERAKLGLFLAFQNPVAIPGVSVSHFLRVIFQASKSSKNLDNKASPLEFYKFIEQKAKYLNLDQNFLSRSLNDGFSGGEKKKLEMLQLLVSQPNFAIIDEIDTGLDIDALKIVAKAISSFSTSKIKPGILIISHYQRIFNYLKPDFVHIMKNGKIVLSGKYKLIAKIEKEGYAKIAN